MEFDWKYYINRYSDLKKSGINTKKKAYQHWIKYGRNENRIPCENYKKNRNTKKTFFNDIDNKLNESENSLSSISNNNSSNSDINDIKKDITSIKNDIKLILKLLNKNNNISNNSESNIKSILLDNISDEKVISSEDYVFNENELNDDISESRKSINSEDIDSDNFIKYSNSNEFNNLSYEN